MQIDITKNYIKKDLDEEQLLQLAWMITNENVIGMFNQVGQSLLLHNGIQFDFNINSLKIKARVIERNKGTRVLEILEFGNK